MVVMASEVGVLPIPESRILKKWRLQPGKMFLIDTEQGRIIDDAELKQQLAASKPYKEWIKRIRIKLDDLPAGAGEKPSSAARVDVPLLDRQQAFGYTQEDVKLLMEPMALQGEEAIGSMGNDSALPVLSNKTKPLYNYFKQLFAQVTNPPIDPIREQMVMSLVSFIGPKPNLLDINNINPPMRLEVSQPVLDFKDMAKMRSIENYSSNKFRSFELDVCYPLAWGKEGVEARLASLCAQAVDAVKAGYNILIVTDRSLDAGHVAIPALLATSAVHQHLIAEGLRTSTGLVVETGSVREVHHFALLAGYGAEAVHPYLALETLIALHGADADKAIKNYVKAVGKGLNKVMSKMGISTYMSYCGAQIFEAVGLNRDLVDKYFRGTASNVGGMGLFEVMEEAVRAHRAAFSDDPVLATMLDAGGEYQWRVRGEEHMWTPDAIAKLQHSTRANSYQTYKEYAQVINDQGRRHMTLRGLFEFRIDPKKAIPLDEVEPAKDIVKRFATGAMSLGSISTEAHSTLAIAMNRLGGKSNTGEGGEDERRYQQELRGIPIRNGDTLASVLGSDRVVADIPLKEGDSLRSKIKQVASGRFGVTTEYLVSADQIQIKMAQGAKPGEGGQLPGHKVSEYIAKLRFSVPGVGLISPPPHHDIYSIEDLAQLIHDLKNANPQASISVKLVSEVGVGTVAAGVAKAKADHVTISGHDGGTGASPVSSIKHAGTPWELGLAETQQTLVLNRLRGRIAVQVDGQMKTGRDVVIGALLGADEFGFATAPLVVEGCIMMRKCHLNTCPVGVATQDPALRAKFKGQPEHVVNFFFFVAEEVREIMAQLGIRRFEELIGRADLLDTKRGIDHWKARGLDFSRIFYQPKMPADVARLCVESQDHGLVEGARPQADRAEQAGAGARRAGQLHHADPQRQPLGRHDAVVAGRQEVRPRGPAGRHDPHPAERHRGAELRRVPRARHHARPRRRRQRLHRQGPVRRPGDRALPERFPRGRHREHHRRQHGAVRRHRGRGVLQRRGRRALRGPQLGGRGGRRGHRRPRLRVHDQGHGGRARRHGAELRGRHVGRDRLRLRRERRLRDALQPVDVRTRARAAGRRAAGKGRRGDLAPRRDRRVHPARPDREPLPPHRQPARTHDPRPVAGDAGEVREGVPERVPARTEGTGGGAGSAGAADGGVASVGRTDARSACAVAAAAAMAARAAAERAARAAAVVAAR